MAEDLTREQTTNRDEDLNRINQPVLAGEDPGRAHAKGFSADPNKPDQAIKEEDPVPLAPDTDTHPAFRVPERDKKVQPTGRNESGEYTPNDRLMGSDR